MKHLIILILTFALLSCNKDKSALEISIDTLLANNTNKPFNGNILIARDGKVEYSKCYGYADMENKTPLKTNDQFVIGSISKQFTAAIVLQEYDKGHIDLYIPIRNYLPDLPQAWADSVTVHHLLAHTHGIVALDKPTLFKIGTEYDYSQIGYDLLSKIAEKTSGKSFVELSSELFDACNMKDTFHPEANKHQQLVKGYEEKEGKLAYTDKSFRQYPAAGTFISTIDDLKLWNENLFEGKLLKEETFKMMATKQENAVRNHPIFGLTEYGYGITVDEKDQLLQWGQTGYTPGFISMNFYFPQTKTSVIVLENVIYDLDDIKKMFKYHTDILDIVKQDIAKTDLVYVS